LAVFCKPKTGWEQVSGEDFFTTSGAKDGRKRFPVKVFSPVSFQSKVFGVFWEATSEKLVNITDWKK